MKPRRNYFGESYFHHDIIKHALNTSKFKKEFTPYSSQSNITNVQESKLLSFVQDFPSSNHLYKLRSHLTQNRTHAALKERMKKYYLPMDRVDDEIISNEKIKNDINDFQHQIDIYEKEIMKMLEKEMEDIKRESKKTFIEKSTFTKLIIDLGAKQKTNSSSLTSEKEKMESLIEIVTNKIDKIETIKLKIIKVLAEYEKKLSSIRDLHKDVNDNSLSSFEFDAYKKRHVTDFTNQLRTQIEIFKKELEINFLKKIPLITFMRILTERIVKQVSYLFGEELSRDTIVNILRSDGNFKPTLTQKDKNQVQNNAKKKLNNKLASLISEKIQEILNAEYYNFEKYDVTQDKYQSEMRKEVLREIDDIINHLVKTHLDEITKTI